MAQKIVLSKNQVLRLIRQELRIYNNGSLTLGDFLEKMATGKLDSCEYGSQMSLIGLISEPKESREKTARRILKELKEKKK